MWEAPPGLPRPPLLGSRAYPSGQCSVFSPRGPRSALDEPGSNPSSSNSSEDSLHRGAKRRGLKSSIGRLFGKKDKARRAQQSRDGAAGHGLGPSQWAGVVQGPEAGGRGGVRSPLPASPTL